MSAAQIAFAGLEAKRLQGYRIEAKPQGRQPKRGAEGCKASQPALRELPSAKELAAELGVNDQAVRVVLKSYRYPEVQQKLLSGEIAPKSAEHQMEGFNRETGSTTAGGQRPNAGRSLQRWPTTALPATSFPMASIRLTPAKAWLASSPKPSA